MTIRNVDELSNLMLLMDFEEVVTEIAKGNEEPELYSYRMELENEIHMRMSEGYIHEHDDDDYWDDLEEDDHE